MRILIICLLTSLSPLCVKAQNWQWSNQVGSNIIQSYDQGSVITDGTNYYLVGKFSGSLYLQTDTLGSNGTNNMFIIKYDSNGNEIWAKTFGGDMADPMISEFATAAYDSVSNNIYLAGKYSGQMILDAVDTLNSFSSMYGFFIARMDLNGNFIWGISVDEFVPPIGLTSAVAEVFVSPIGDLFVTLGLNDTVIFQGYTLYPGGCLLRLDANGICNFARNLFSNFETMVNVDFIQNDLILSGYFQDSIYTLDTATLVSSGDYDAFIARTDYNGNMIWLQHYGSSGYEIVGGVDIYDPLNEIYFCGGFTDSVTFNNVTYYNSGRDILFGKLAGNGNIIWIKQCQGTNNTGVAIDIKTDNDGNFYSVGYFSGSALFGNFPVTTTNTFDMFLAGYNSNGDCLGVKHFGQADCSSLVIDNSGNPVCAGAFLNTVTIGSNTFTSNGYVDVFIAKSDAIIGMEEEDRVTNIQLLIFANPNAGKCTITVPDEFLNENNLDLSIFDNSGKLIQQEVLKMNDGRIKLNMEAEAKGVYNIILSNKNKSYNGKIIFE